MATFDVQFKTMVASHLERPTGARAHGSESCVLRRFCEGEALRGGLAPWDRRVKSQPCQDVVHGGGSGKDPQRQRSTCLAR